jgi:hypothetical protein
MERIIRRTGDFGTSIGAILTAFTLVCAMGGAAGPALAQDRDHNARGQSDVRASDRHNTLGHVGAPNRRAHDRQGVRAYERPGYRPAYGYDTPSYGNYPPPIVYAPPAPSAGINFIIPLFR